MENMNATYPGNLKCKILKAGSISELTDFFDNWMIKNRSCAIMQIDPQYLLIPGHQTFTITIIYRQSV